MGPQCNYVYPYKTKGERDVNTERARCDDGAVSGLEMLV